MEQILSKNVAFIPDLDFNWIGWSSSPALRKKENSLVIECKTAAQANRVMEEGLAIRGELYRCTLYNPACEQKKCFNCQQYQHLAVYCTNTKSFGYSTTANRSQESKKDMPKKCVLCKRANETWDYRCEFKKKELERIGKAKEQTQSRYETHSAVISTQAPVLAARSRLSAFQGISNILSLPPPRTNKRPIASESQSLTKLSTTDRETRSNIAGKTSADRTALAEISSSQQARREQNWKVQVFEGKKPSVDKDGPPKNKPKSSQGVILLSLSRCAHKLDYLCYSTTCANRKIKLWHFSLTTPGP